MKTKAYEKRGLFRPQHDIDILVDEDDLVDFILLCKQIGYDTSFVDLTIFKSEIDLGNQHLPMITKSVFNHYFSIGLEIHCSLGPNAFSVIPADDILKNRTLSTQPPHFYSMDIYDRIIFNLCHFSRHYLSEMLPFKGLFIHNNINGFGLEIYVGVNGGLYYWSNGSKPYHNPARFGYVALHP